MMEEHQTLKARAEAIRKADADIEAAWLKQDMEDDEAYQASRDLNAMEGEPFYDEHSDSAYQCGKDRDDR